MTKRDDLHYEIIKTLQANGVVCNGPVIKAVDKLVDQLIPRTFAEMRTALRAAGGSDWDKHGVKEKLAEIRGE